MWDAIQQKKPEKQRKKWILHLVMSPLQCSIWWRSKFQQSPSHSISRSHSVISDCLNKTALIANHFASAEEIQQKATSGLTPISKEDFQRCLQQNCWGKCVCAEGQYFKADYIRFIYFVLQIMCTFRELLLGTFWSSHIYSTAKDDECIMNLKVYRSGCSLISGSVLAFRKVLRQILKSSVRIAGLWAKIWTSDLPKMKPEYYPLNHDTWRNIYSL